MSFSKLISMLEAGPGCHHSWQSFDQAHGGFSGSLQFEHSGQLLRMLAWCPRCGSLKGASASYEFILEPTTDGRPELKKL